jgi:hypothetical protein
MHCIVRFSGFKLPILFFALFIGLTAFIRPQGFKDRHQPPFVRSNQQNIYEQTFRQQHSSKEFLEFQKHLPLKKSIKKSSTTYRPGKIICDNSDSTAITYTYDIFGNCLTEAHGRNYQHIYTYDNSGNRLTTIFQWWVNNDWVNSSRSSYTYDDSGNCLIFLWEKWSDSAWTVTGRNCFTYNSAGLMLTNLCQWWSNDKWVQVYIEKYDYDSNGNCLTDFYQRWVNNEWQNGDRHTNTYDISGNCLTQFYEECSDTGWVNEYRNTYTYSNSGYRHDYVYEIWQDNAWMIYTKDTYTYDNSGNCMTDLCEHFDNGIYSNWYRSTFTYDNYHNYITAISEHFNYNSEWIYDYRTNYGYDNYANCIHGESFYWQDSSWVPSEGGIDIWYNYHKDVLPFYNLTVDMEYISFTGVSEENSVLTSFNLQQNFPNPFNPSTTINYSLPVSGNVKLTVYNILGRKVATIVDGYKAAGNYSVLFNGSNLASGIYMYRLEAGNYSFVKKLTLIK